MPFLVRFVGLRSHVLTWFVLATTCHRTVVGLRGYRGSPAAAHAWFTLYVPSLRFYFLRCRTAHATATPLPGSVRSVRSALPPPYLPAALILPYMPTVCVLLPAFVTFPCLRSLVLWVTHYATHCCAPPHTRSTTRLPPFVYVPFFLLASSPSFITWLPSAYMRTYRIPYGLDLMPRYHDSTFFTVRSPTRRKTLYAHPHTATTYT